MFFVEIYEIFQQLFSETTHSFVKTVNPEAFSGPNKISKMELFAEKVNGFQSFIIFAKSTILDVLNTF